MHDPRVGRFFAVDPLAPKYPHNSPYAFSENRLLDGVELEGLEVIGVAKQTTFSFGVSFSNEVGAVWSYNDDGFFGFTTNGYGLEGNVSGAFQYSFTIFPYMKSIKDFEGGGYSAGLSYSPTFMGVGAPMGGSLNFVWSDNNDMGINVTVGIADGVLPLSFGIYRTQTSVMPITKKSKELFDNAILNKAKNILTSAKNDLVKKVNKLTKDNIKRSKRIANYVQLNKRYDTKSYTKFINKERDKIFENLKQIEEKIKTLEDGVKVIEESKKKLKENKDETD